MAPPIRDTSPHADAVHMLILRQMPAARRGSLAAALSRTVIAGSRHGIARRAPTLTPRQILATSIAINYGPAWAERVQARLATHEDSMLDPLMQTALTPVIDLFDQVGIRYYLGGSLASSIHGIPRATLDADVVALVQEHHLPPLIAGLQDAFYYSEAEMRAALQQQEGTPSFNLIHLTMGVKIDVFVPLATPFAAARMERARPAAFDESPQARQFLVASAEDMVLTKLAWYDAGNRISERQWADILGILRIQRDQIDQAYLQQWAPVVGVRDLLAQAWAEASRADPR